MARTLAATDATLTVDEINGRTDFRKFVELPFALHHGEPRWAPPVMSYERARLDPRMNPALDPDTRYLLARRRGRIVGRVLAFPGGGFGCFDVADIDAGVALVEAVTPTEPGPVPVGEEQPGVLVGPGEVVGATGRQWHPPVYGVALAAAGLTVVEERAMWRLPAEALTDVPVGRGAAPVSAGAYADPRLVFRDVAAVPDVAAALRGTRPDRAWGLARRARRREWETCTVVRIDGDPAALVPAIASAAAHAGYRWVLAPWGPPGADPEARYAIYGPG